MDAFKSLAPRIQSIADRLERFAVANDVADYLGVDEKLVRDHFSKGTPNGTGAPRRPVMPPTERLLLHSLLASETARAQVIPELSGLDAIDRFRLPERVSGSVCNAFRWRGRSVFRPGRPPFRGRSGPIVVGRICR